MRPALRDVLDRLGERLCCLVGYHLWQGRQMNAPPFQYRVCQTCGKIVAP